MVPLAFLLIAEDGIGMMKRNDLISMVKGETRFMSELSRIFGSKVFNDAIMRERLPKTAYKSLKNTIESNIPLNPDVAEVVASAMKDWAIEQGATHYSHWFQPMTGLTAEKHDSFISPTNDGRVILEFSGKELIKGEPDASSFPNGGIRATFEARGYTAWDCTSPAFVKNDTLCIPTAFCSYTGEALDKKTPLLRSMDALNKQGMRVLKALGNTSSGKVVPNVGPEQEYFLIDSEMFKTRKDLIFTGRTLFGAKPPKGQEMEDQYYATIKTRVMDYMKELDNELWKLGIPAKTRHNEVAPSQHEIAPIYNTSNVATDQNQLLMETMKTVAARHGLACLLHEKPFAGVNGSGKHNNWSVGTDDGINLFNPGHEPHKNDQFMLFLACVIKAVDDYADVLRIAAANPGNDHRLGANEAPPAIISIFLGEQLTAIIDQMLEKGEAADVTKAARMHLGAITLPSFRKDVSDRNRTSPFAFTGNKFEYRMVGSSASIADANFILNTSYAEILSQVADRLEKAADAKAEAKAITLEYLRDHSRIIFNGDNYTEEWLKEAARRGLPNLSNMVDAVSVFNSPKSIALFTKHGVFTEREIHSRYEVYLESYVKTIHIEASTALLMVRQEIIPSVIRYTTDVAASFNELKATGLPVSVGCQEELLSGLTGLLASVCTKVKELETALTNASEQATMEMKANTYRDAVAAALLSLRTEVDKLETLVGSEYWPIPTYADLLFGVS